jgi:GntR family transcriptional regulator
VIVQYKLYGGKKEGERMIILDYKDTRPIYEQIVEKFKMLILKGVLQKDEQMPSVRSLAVELSINPNTIQKAYAELERQGYLYVVKGRGNFISDNKSLLNERKEELKNRVVFIYREGLELGMTKRDFMELLQGMEE